jgi:glycosyltransferase involved in cell wall biosynthesis
MDQTQYTLSIAIVTRNRPESLERALESLSKQNAQPFEIIISDDSNLEDMIAANKALAKTYGARHILGPQNGLYANRNFVARNCTGSHFRTMDDDHEFPENHIKNCLEAIQQDPDAIWTIGEYCPPDENRSLPAPIPGQLHPMGYSYSPANMNTYFGISCGATIYPNKVVIKNILNLEVYKFGVVYLEYGARLFSNGFRFRHLDKTFVIHHVDMEDVMARSISSVIIINSARVFSMLSLSFHHQRTIKHRLLTSFAIAKDILTGKYTIQLFLNTYRQYKNAIKESLI